jgi:hypothetical protein
MVAANESAHYWANPIELDFAIAAPAGVSLVGSTLEFLIKRKLTAPDSEALTYLTCTASVDGQIVVGTESASTLTGKIKLKGLVTAKLPNKEASLHYELKLTYSGQTHGFTLEKGTLGILAGLKQKPTVGV